MYPSPNQTNQLPAVLVDIARCESHQQQYNADGSVLRGEENSQDVGYFQINEHYHAKAAARMGDDIYTEEGNIKYALYLYYTQGTAPWGASKSCWGAGGGSA